MLQPSLNFHFPKFLFSLLGSLLIFIQCTSNNPVSVQKNRTITHESDISENETWSSSQEHVVTNDVFVKNSILTIEAGTVVKFQPGTSLKIQSGGQLVARGTQKDSIRFTRSKTDSAWKNIEIDTNSESCELAFCAIENGGQGNDNLNALVVCKTGQISLTNCSIRNSETNGLSVLKTVDFTSFKNNKITGNALAPVVLSLSKITSLSPENSFTGNVNDIIRVVESDPISEDVVWQVLAVPYQFSVNLNIRGFKLNLRPGVHLQFESFTGIEISNNGRLTAIGTPDSVIKFRGVESKPGFWQGVYLKNDNPSAEIQFSNCVFSDGGSTPFQYDGGQPLNANFFGEGGIPKFSNCRFENSSGYGVIFSKNSLPAQFEQNTISRNQGLAMRVHPAVINQLKQVEIYDNFENAIEVTRGEITQPVTIPNNLVPYRLSGEVNIFYATVTIDPGTAFELNSQASLAIRAGGALVADGISPAGAITFSGTLKQPGAWKYVYFGRDCNETACKLNFCNLQYGGGDIGWPSIIYLEGASPQITNCQISYSKHWGIFKSNNAEPNLANTIFYSNYDGDIWP